MKTEYEIFLIFALAFLFQHFNLLGSNLLGSINSGAGYNKNHKIYKNVHDLGSYIVRDNLWKNGLNTDLVHKFWCLEHLAICHIEELLSSSPDLNYNNKSNICSTNSYCYQARVYPKCEFNNLERYLYFQNFQDIQEEYCSHTVGLKHGFRIQKLKLEKQNIFIPSHNFDQIQIPNFYSFECDQERISITLEYYFIIKEFFESEI